MRLGDQRRIRRRDRDRGGVGLAEHVLHDLRLAGLVRGRCRAGVEALVLRAGVLLVPLLAALVDGLEERIVETLHDDDELLLWPAPVRRRAPAPPRRASNASFFISFLPDTSGHACPLRSMPGSDHAGRLGMRSERHMPMRTASAATVLVDSSVWNRRCRGGSMSAHSADRLQSSADVRSSADADLTRVRSAKSAALRAAVDKSRHTPSERCGERGREAPVAVLELTEHLEAFRRHPGASTTSRCRSSRARSSG